jgi:3-oxoacyl-(acyl-carrier-protein) synthase
MLGEGGFALVAENWSRAQDRSATIYAEIIGVGGTSSPCGINQWPRDPTHLARSMELALEEADTRPQDIGVVFASGNGAIELDRTEASAIRDVFGEAGVKVVSIKGALGESGTTGAASLAAAILSLREQRIPPTVGLEELDPACAVDASPEARPIEGTRGLINSFASGGANYSVVVEVVKGG